MNPIQLAKTIIFLVGLQTLRGRCVPSLIAIRSVAGYLRLINTPEDKFTSPIRFPDIELGTALCITAQKALTLF